MGVQYDRCISLPFLSGDIAPLMSLEVCWLKSTQLSFAFDLVLHLLLPTVCYVLP